MADAVTGEEKISKNELKRRLKAEKAKADKALKEKARADKQPAEAKERGTGNTEVDQDSCDPGEYFNNRKNFVNQVKKSGDNPYPHKFQVTTSLVDFIEKYSTLNAG